MAVIFVAGVSVAGGEEDVRAVVDVTKGLDLVSSDDLLLDPSSEGVVLEADGGAVCQSDLGQLVFVVPAVEDGSCRGVLFDEVAVVVVLGAGVSFCEKLVCGVVGVGFDPGALLAVADGVVLVEVFLFIESLLEAALGFSVVGVVLGAEAGSGAFGLQ